MDQYVWRASVGIVLLVCSTGCAASHLVPVQLRYQGPADADVAVAGSWDGWTVRVPLAYIGGGVHARLLNLEPGTHHYKYVSGPRDAVHVLGLRPIFMGECGVKAQMRPVGSGF